MSDEARSLEGHTTRRAILAATLGGFGAWVAGALGRAAPVAAADGDVVHVGDTVTGASTTVFNVSTASYSALWGNATAGSGTGVGVRGDSASTAYGSAGVLGNGRIGVYGKGSAGVRGEGAAGVEGVGDSVGVYGFSSTGHGVAGNTDTGSAAVSGVAGNSAAGVQGVSYNHGTGVYGLSNGSNVNATFKAKTGVYGEALQDTSSRGVWGKSSVGQGVRGEVGSGIGVYGVASSRAGYAFRGSGRVRFDKVCGVATIPAGATSVTVSPGVDVTADSFVLLTAKANIGSRSLYFSTDTANDKFTIRLSSSLASNAVVAWLLLR